MRLNTKKGQQFSLLSQIEDVGNDLQAGDTKFKLFALFLHFIGCIAFLTFVPEPSSDKLGAIAPFVKPFLLSLITLAMPWISLFASNNSDSLEQSFINAAKEFDSQNLDHFEKNETSKNPQTGLILFPVLSLLIGLVFIMILAWQLGSHILLGLFAIFLVTGVAYFAFASRTLKRLNKLSDS
jgi:hypothetical protein